MNAREAAVHTALQGLDWERPCLIWPGKEIAEAVCRQLRQREFAEADPPMRGA